MKKKAFNYACASAYGSGLRFLKDAIQVGKYTHPKHGWELDVTPTRIDKWVKSMAMMLANGVPIPLVKDHKVTSDATMGYVNGSYRDDSRLMFTLEVPSEKEAEEVKRVNNVSIFVEEDFTDGKGNKYDEAITHIALTPEPVAPGQAGFISIAASSGQGSEEIPVFSLAAEGASQMRKELLQEFRTLTKAAVEAAEDDVLDKVRTFVQTKISEHAELSKKVADLQAQLEAASAKKADEKPTLSAEDAEERASDVATDIESMVKEGKLTPALAASLQVELCGTAEGRNEYMLSRSAVASTNGIRPIRARRILSLIREIKPVHVAGSQTAGQGGKALSRDTEPEGTKLTDRLLQSYGGSKQEAALVM